MAVNSKFKIPNVRELFKSLKNIRGEWKLKTPMQKWCYLYGVGRAAFGLVCIPLMNDVNHLHWFAYSTFLYMFGAPAMSLYTIWYYAYHGDLQLGLPSTCLACICIGHIPMGVVVVFNMRFELQSLIDFGGRCIYHDSHEKTEYNRICSDHMDITIKRYILKMKSIAVSFVVAVIAPSFAYFANGVLSTTLETRIPFTEPKSNAEFIFNFIGQYAIGTHGFLCYFGLETFQSMLESVITIVPRLIKIELVHNVESHERKMISELELRKRIGNIVKQSNDTDK